MISDIDVSGVNTWKYVDDTVISEIVPRGKPSTIQAVVDELAAQSAGQRFRLNESKCKELCIVFSGEKRNIFEPVVINYRHGNNVPTPKFTKANDLLVRPDHFKRSEMERACI